MRIEIQYWPGRVNLECPPLPTAEGYLVPKTKTSGIFWDGNRANNKIPLQDRCGREECRENVRGRNSPTSYIVRTTMDDVWLYIIMLYRNAKKMMSHSINFPCRLCSYCLGKTRQTRCIGHGIRVRRKKKNGSSSE